MAGVAAQAADERERSGRGTLAPEATQGERRTSAEGRAVRRTRAADDATRHSSVTRGGGARQVVLYSLVQRIDSTYTAY